MATIEIPRLDGESSRAYAARVEYLTAGQARDLRSLAQKLDKSLTIVGRWSSHYGWVDHARRYDETLAGMAAQAHAEQYRADLEAHRGDAMKYGKALCGVAIEMLAQLRVEAKTVEYTPAALSTIARALTVGMDLQAHALRIGDILPRLDDGSE